MRLCAIVMALAATTAQAQKQNDSAELQIVASPFLVFEWAEELSADAALTDIDMDGDLDIVVGNSERPNYLYRQRSDLSFERITVDEEASDTYGLAIGDVNLDGTPDVVFANSEAPNAVYLVRKRSE